MVKLRGGFGAKKEGRNFKGQPGGDKSLLDGIGSVLKASEATRGLGEYRRILLDAVERDPNQPRDDLPTKEEVIACREQGLDAVAEEKREVMQGIISLAKSIDAGELLHAIKVINLSDESTERYRIRTGERRYLAHIYLGETSIPAVIHTSDAVSDQDAIYFEQLVENIQRQDLTLAQRFRGLRYFSGYNDENGTSLNKLTPEEIQEILGVKKSQAYKYRKVLAEGTSELFAAIDAGKVPTIDTAYDCVVLPQEQRETHIAAMLNPASSASDAASAQTDTPSGIGDKREEEGNETPPLEPAPKPKKKAGRNKEKVNLGQVVEAKVIRVIMEALGEQEPDLISAYDLEATDWGDLNKVEKMWKELLKALEKSHG